MNGKLIFIVSTLSLFLPMGGLAWGGPVVSDGILFAGAAATFPEGGPPGSETLMIPGTPLPPGIAVQLYEDPNLTILSDQLYTVQGAQGSTLIFRSDPDLITLDPNVFAITNTVETGVPQDVSADFGLAPGLLQVFSDVDSVPEPAALSLFGIGVLALAGYNWHRRNVAAA